MRLVTFADGKGQRLGVLEGEEIADVTAAARDLPQAVAAYCGNDRLEELRRALGRAPRLRAADVRLLAPIPRPAKNIFCVGKNYHEHAKEFHDSGFDASAGAAAIPDLPIIFTKAATTVIGPEAPIPGSSDPTQSVDYEGELTVVIGKGGRGIRKADAHAHVFGYTIINDVTARTLQHAHKQWFLGKNLDGFCPMGPCVVTADEVPDVGGLRLETRVNGEVRQSAAVSDLIFDIPTLIETISGVMTLEPGDLIATGTPVGVGIGFKPPKYLKAGDTVSITIEPIGTLTNPVA
ncbi:MAG TPA: fumarylacetoacetate hydrolase family protein [Beijerinckiaceae bacterium]|nr:fumarylacetoacetate hydrolase family protein [Beijerinckiaceae bacterium]